MTQQRHSELHLIAIFDSGGDTRTAIDRSNVNADSLDASGIEMPNIKPNSDKFNTRKLDPYLAKTSSEASLIKISRLLAMRLVPRQLCPQ